MSTQKYPQSATVSAGGKVKHSVIHRDNYSHAKADARKQRRRDEAEARQFKYENLTPEEKYATLDPKGSTRQWKRLEAKFPDASPYKKGKTIAVVTVKSDAVVEKPAVKKAKKPIVKKKAAKKPVKETAE